MFASAGSRFWQGGSFEVRKNTTSPGDSTDGSVTSKSALEVVIPSELDGSAYVQVEVRSVPGTVNLEVFARYKFSLIALKGIFAMLEICDLGMMYLYQ